MRDADIPGTLALSGKSQDTQENRQGNTASHGVSKRQRREYREPGIASTTLITLARETPWAGGF